VLENVVLDEDHDVDYTDTSITQNTRGAYPIEFIQNAKVPCIARHPTDVIFLTCDAFGVLPPVSALSPSHAMYHFISGYTAKVAGTEMGVTEPQATFSPCFGGPFLVWHPSKYAENATTPFGVSERFSRKVPRNRAVHNCTANPKRL
jgi:phosphoenolpyruvate carboxykinase (ATP)